MNRISVIFIVTTSESSPYPTTANLRTMRSVQLNRKISRSKENCGCRVFRRPLFYEHRGSRHIYLNAPTMNLTGKAEKQPQTNPLPVKKPEHPDFTAKILHKSPFTAILLRPRPDY